MLFLQRYSNYLIVLLVAVAIAFHPPVKNWESKFVKLQANGSLQYIPDEKGEMQAVKLRNEVTHQERLLPVACVFVAIGHDPNTKAFRGKLETDQDGYLLVRHLAESKHPGVFIAGDVADRVYKQAITAAGSGCAAAIEAERYLSGLEH